MVYLKDIKVKCVGVEAMKESERQKRTEDLLASTYDLEAEEYDSSYLKKPKIDRVGEIYIYK